MTVHHYMVDYEDAAGAVQFANDTLIYSLSDAKTLAKTKSLATENGSAYAVAFSDNGDGTFTATGHVGYYLGHVSDEDGAVL